MIVILVMVFAKVMKRISDGHDTTMRSLVAAGMGQRKESSSDRMMLVEGREGDVI